MDWYKTKNIIIFVLVILNIAVFSVYYRTDTQDKILSSQTKDNVVSILSESNISLDKKIIPDTPESLTGCYLERAIRSNSGFATKLMGQNYTYDENSGGYRSASKSLKISNGDFDFSDSAPQNPPEKTDEGYIKEYCRNEMKKMGIDEKLYSFGGLNRFDGGIKAIFSTMLGEYEIFDSFISFEISKNGINKISGKNVVLGKTAEGVETKVFSINSVLLDVPQSGALGKEKLSKIISIKLGYYMGDSEEAYSSVLAIPVWQIATDGGVILYYDARNGKLL